MYGNGRLATKILAVEVTPQSQTKSPATFLFF